jgi:hypothetical protein
MNKRNTIKCTPPETLTLTIINPSEVREQEEKQCIIITIIISLYDMLATATIINDEHYFLITVYLSGHLIAVELCKV